MSQLAGTNFVSIKHILNRLLRDEPYINTINLGDAVEWAGECINSLGINDLFTTSSCTVEIKDYRGTLPNNFKSIEGVREVTSNISLNLSSSKFPNSVSSNNNSGNIFDFSINENVIFVGFETGELEIIFKGYNLDDEGFPKINDDEALIRCIYYYIAEKIAFQKFAMGKLPQQIYDRIEQRSLFYLSSARYKGKTPNKLQMQSILDQQTQIVPNQNLYRNNFVTLDNIEKFKIND